MSSGQSKDSFDVETIKETVFGMEIMGHQIKIRKPATICSTMEPRGQTTDRPRPLSAKGWNAFECPRRHVQHRKR